MAMSSVTLFPFCDPDQVPAVRVQSITDTFVLEMSAAGHTFSVHCASIDEIRALAAQIVHECDKLDIQGLKAAAVEMMDGMRDDDAGHPYAINDAVDHERAMDEHGEPVG